MLGDDWRLPAKLLVHSASEASQMTAIVYLGQHTTVVCRGLCPMRTRATYEMPQQGWRLECDDAWRQIGRTYGGFRA